MPFQVYDVEVLRGPKDVEGGWKNPEAMGFGTAVVYDSEHDTYLFFSENQKDDLIRTMTGHRVVSFNGIKFDNSVVLGNDYDLSPWDDVDLLIEVVRSKFGLPSLEAACEKLANYDKNVHDGSISLDGLSEGTLGMKKTGSGAHAPELIREAKWAEVYAYNLHDVRLTRKLFEFAQTYGYLIDRKGNKIELPKFD